MTNKRQALLERVSSLPEEILDDVASSVDDIEALYAAGPYRLSDEERTAVRRGLEAMKQGDIAQDQELEAFIRRHSA